MNASTLKQKLKKNKNSKNWCEGSFANLPYQNIMKN